MSVQRFMSCDSFEWISSQEENNIEIAGFSREIEKGIPELFYMENAANRYSIDKKNFISLLKIENLS